MKQIKSNIDTNEDQFKDNVASYSRLIDTYRSTMKSVINRKEDSAVVKHRLRGKLDARNRIELLIDEKTPFLELCGLCGLRVEKKSSPQKNPPANPAGSSEIITCPSRSVMTLFARPLNSASAQFSRRSGMWSKLGEVMGGLSFWFVLYFLTKAPGAAPVLVTSFLHLSFPRRREFRVAGGSPPAGYVHT